jgi:hypothetical protein
MNAYKSEFIHCLYSKYHVSEITYFICVGHGQYFINFEDIIILASIFFAV